MEFFKKHTNIAFMGARRYTAVASVVMICASLFFIYTKGLNFALDFTGGSLLELRLTEAVDLEAVRGVLKSKGFEDAKVMQYGTPKDILIRIANRQNDSEQVLGKRVLEAVNSEIPADLRRIEFVGSEVGEQLAEQGGLAVLAAILASMIYIAMRFEYRFAISAALALLHDPILILGIFSAFQIEFDLATLASLLAVIGYSLNDTIVVYDRVRENFRKIRKSTAREIIDLSINQTLSRTIMTSVMTSLVVVALLFFGGESLSGFSLAFLIGIVVGTYSSIYVAGAVALALGLDKKDMIPASKKPIDDLP
jgi:preprotein translocase subunit SecF